MLRRDQLDIIGAPSSAGAYAPGQEKAPAALRAAGLVSALADRGVVVRDRGDVPGWRWRADRDSPRAMNAGPAGQVARGVAAAVRDALREGSAALVIGGDCTVELGSVAGAAADGDEIRLVYIDSDADLNTPASVSDGALDWMGVAHMLDLPGGVTELAGLGARRPLLHADQLVLFASDNTTPFEREVIRERGIRQVALREVAADPARAARGVIEGWATRSSRLLIHLDVDVLDFCDLPIAENTRRNQGLRFDQLLPALGALLTAPSWAVLTICEVNPDHADGSIMEAFVRGIAGTLSSARRSVPPRVARPPGTCSGDLR